MIEQSLPQSGIIRPALQRQGGGRSGGLPCGKAGAHDAQRTEGPALGAHGAPGEPQIVDPRRAERILNRCLSVDAGWGIHPSKRRCAELRMTTYFEITTK